jgi:hypothetical protein
MSLWPFGRRNQPAPEPVEPPEYRPYVPKHDQVKRPQFEDDLYSRTVATHWIGLAPGEDGGPPDLTGDLWRAIDAFWVDIANWYLNGTEREREEIRAGHERFWRRHHEDRTEPKSMYPLDAYMFVNRAMLLCEGDDGVKWVRRALAAVAIDAGVFSRKNAITALRNIKKWTRTSGLDPRPLMEQAIDMSSEDTARWIQKILDEES